MPRVPHSLIPKQSHKSSKNKVTIKFGRSIDRLGGCGVSRNPRTCQPTRCLKTTQGGHFARASSTCTRPSANKSAIGISPINAYSYYVQDKDCILVSEYSHYDSCGCRIAARANPPFQTTCCGHLAFKLHTHASANVSIRKC